MTPINMDDSRLSHFVNTVNCQRGSFPFTYLGLPLGITKPTLEHFIPLVVRVEKDFVELMISSTMVESCRW
jgi:hypothetical protein